MCAGTSDGHAGMVSTRTAQLSVVRKPTLPCRDQPDLYFAESPALLTRAKELCLACPIREACLSGAVERREPWGVWGGEIFEDGRVIAVKRGRGRPRKQAAA